MPVADALIDRIDEKLRRLETHPRMGRSRSDVGIALRSFTIGSCVLWYRPTIEGIELVRVLHGSRDVRKVPIE